MQRAQQYLDKIVEEIRRGLLKPAIGDRHLEITTSVALDEDIANAIIWVAEHGESAEGGSVPGRCDCNEYSRIRWIAALGDGKRNRASAACYSFALVNRSTNGPRNGSIASSDFPTRAISSDRPGLIFEPFCDHVLTGLDTRLSQRPLARINELVGHASRYHDDLPSSRLQYGIAHRKCRPTFMEYKYFLVWVTMQPWPLPRRKVSEVEGDRLTGEVPALA